MKTVRSGGAVDGNEAKIRNNLTERLWRNVGMREKEISKCRIFQVNL